MTTTQQAQATTIFTTEQAALAALVTPKQTAQAALQAAIQTNNTAGIQARALALGRLQEQQVLADAMAEAAFYGILTPVQQTTYATGNWPSSTKSTTNKPDVARRAMQRWPAALLSQTVSARPENESPRRATASVGR